MPKRLYCIIVSLSILCLLVSWEERVNAREPEAANAEVIPYIDTSFLIARGGYSRLQTDNTGTVPAVWFTITEFPLGGFCVRQKPQTSGNLDRALGELVHLIAALRERTDEPIGLAITATGWSDASPFKPGFDLSTRDDCGIMKSTSIPTGKLTPNEQVAYLRALSSVSELRADLEHLLGSAICENLAMANETDRPAPGQCRIDIEISNRPEETGGEYRRADVRLVFFRIPRSGEPESPASPAPPPQAPVQQIVQVIEQPKDEPTEKTGVIFGLLGGFTTPLSTEATRKHYNMLGGLGVEANFVQIADLNFSLGLRYLYAGRLDGQMKIEGSWESYSVHSHHAGVRLMGSGMWERIFLGGGPFINTVGVNRILDVRGVRYRQLSLGAELGGSLMLGARLFKDAWLWTNVDIGAQYLDSGDWLPISTALFGAGWRFSLKDGE